MKEKLNKMLETLKQKETLKKTLPVVLILFLITITIGVTYSLATYLRESNINTIQTGAVSMSYTESTNVISLNNELPKSDTFGKVQEEYFDFSVTSNMKIEDSITYEIDIEPLSVDSGYNALTNNQIKIYLENKDTNTSVVNSTLISKLKTSALNTNYKVLYANTHNHTSEVESITTSYRLRAWIDYAVDATNWSATNKYQYKFRVNINTTDGTTITTTETPQYCFYSTLDSTTKTATISDYLCNEGNSYSFNAISDVVIPNTLSISEYELVENPSEETIDNCITEMSKTGFPESAGEVLCNGGELDGLTLETIFADDSLSSVVGPILENTGMVNVLSTEFYTVTTIGDSAFFENNLTSVVLSQNLVTIGEEAFSLNYLTTLEIPDEVTNIGSFAFLGNSLNTLTIPNSVTTIGDYAFSDSIIYKQGAESYYNYANNNITNLEIKETKKLEDKCFTTEENEDGTLSITKYNCYEGNSEGYEPINLVSIPKEIDDKTITQISNGAFFDINTMKGIGIMAVTIPDSVETIGAFAFTSNALFCLNIPESVTEIGEYSFYNNDISNIFIPSKIKTISPGAFGNNGLIKIEIPENVTSIGAAAFYANYLMEVSIPDTVTVIEKYAFNSNALSDEQAYFYARTDSNSDGVAEIDYSTIVSYGGASKDITIPSIKNGVTLTTIGEGAFIENELISVIIPEGVETLGNSAFESNYLKNILIPKTVQTIGKYAFRYNSLSYVLIEENSSLASIGTQSFSSKNRSSSNFMDEDAPTYVDNPNLTTIYNNSGKSFDWTDAITGTAGTPFITGTVTSYNTNIVTITTGTPE